ncbi:head GIN domain-containing protein [Salegentibacter sp. F188]|uniref:Head GIN domain-containing protein n=1 Tax=Autumnicola patrickiae TaxID=3075591 RepID=A0ABU3E721_9FLAO|nr:head GIN domain-containing protein [Salegentibacter sp. F188]MDT0691793.1 head GIN domain-containing protein [Salegentibacter sp. F188]
MKNVILLVTVFILSITSANAQWWGNEKVKGNGKVVTDNRSTSDYDEVQLEGFMSVELIAGTEGQIKVEAESNLQEYILTEVSGRKLKISVEKGVQLDPSRNHDIKITVPFKDLEGVSLTGSGDIRTRDRIKTSNFEANLTGSGDLQLELDANNLDGAITGSGDVTFRGTANNFKCRVTGSGDFEAYDLKAKFVEAHISGSGDIMVYASEKLTARVTGSGDISYRGNPEKEDFKTSGSGSVSSY